MENVTSATWPCIHNSLECAGLRVWAPAAVGAPPAPGIVVLIGLHSLFSL